MRPGKIEKRTNQLQDKQGRDEDEHDIHGHIQCSAGIVASSVQKTDVKELVHAV